MIKSLLIAFKAVCFDYYGDYLGSPELTQNQDGSYDVESNHFHYHFGEDSIFDGLFTLPTDPEAVCILRASTEA